MGADELAARVVGCAVLFGWRRAASGVDSNAGDVFAVNPARACAGICDVYRLAREMGSKKGGVQALYAETYYLHVDHLGSIDVTTKTAGAIHVRATFDAWGQRRDATRSGPPTAADLAAIARSTRKGYTSHEQLDNLNLVHMNGRVYDPAIARFFSADPVIQDPYCSQSFNRYSYIWSNPLNATDPTGFECTPIREGSRIPNCTKTDNSNSSTANERTGQREGSTAKSSVIGDARNKSASGAVATDRTEKEKVEREKNAEPKTMEEFISPFLEGDVPHAHSGRELPGAKATADPQTEGGTLVTVPLAVFAQSPEVAKIVTTQSGHWNNARGLGLDGKHYRLVVNLTFVPRQTKWVLGFLAIGDPQSVPTFRRHDDRRGYFVQLPKDLSHPEGFAQENGHYFGFGGRYYSRMSRWSGPYPGFRTDIMATTGGVVNGAHIQFMAEDALRKAR